MEHWTYSHKINGKEGRFWAAGILVHWHKCIKLTITMAIWGSTFQIPGLVKTVFFYIKKKNPLSFKFSFHISSFGYLLQVTFLYLTSCHLQLSCNEGTLECPLESKTGHLQCTSTSGFPSLRILLNQIRINFNLVENWSLLNNLSSL